MSEIGGEIEYEHLCTDFVSLDNDSGNCFRSGLPAFKAVEVKKACAVSITDL
jgi:hypothetical protein